LGEETDISEECHDIMSRLDFTLVNINRIAQSLKRIKADPDREQDIQRHVIGIPAQ
jgi:hypothetical protein